MNKEAILNNICYTDLVYGRINKKLRLQMAVPEIEALVRSAIEQSNAIEKIGKNYYITSHEHRMRITINSFTMRVITVDRIVKHPSE